MTECIQQTQEPWTEEEAAGFAQALVTFGKSLAPRQRDAFAAMLATAGARGGAGGDDGQSHEDVEGLLLPTFYYRFFFPRLEDAVKAITGSADLNKAFEGAQVYIPQ